ncbi:MAG: MarR family winged helix-turn-helix transcriptional regulator [Burkholderiales bacterium]|jgi:DNA-binding MarR family transcriptional regulator|nr:MarR family winged helix-turn-helix transcriptional regulator [Burkholderiales bacterium]
MKPNATGAARNGRGQGRQATRPARPRLRLDAFLPYRLNVAAQRVAEGLAHVYSEQFGVTIPEWRVMAVLGELNEVTAKDIGHLSRMHKAKVSRAVVSLEEHGLIVRRSNEIDRREAFLMLTARGRAIYEGLIPMALAFQHSLVDGISPEDLEAVDRVLKHIMSRVGPAGEPQDTGG